ncbi:cell wall protein DAN4-like [Daphnia pulex]|uniref:cell wall protein DAN4-like n=1 Tax=Daphnia pulex TaxID=6669 RepID=UPI001EDE0C47|nr:cell wall protein DAN4-like [Daphnia pulex]
MKLSLIFSFIYCLAVISVEAQTKTTLKSTTAKGTVTSTKPKVTTLKTTVKATTPKTTTRKVTTLKATTLKTTTRKASSSTTTLKQTTRKTNGTTATTRKPVITTTTASAVKSYKVCRDTTSTATSGSIQPLDGLTPVATGPPKICTFTITAPTDQHVQMSCSLANLTVITNVSNDTYFYILSSSLILEGILDIYHDNVIVPNRVYTSYNNTMTVTYRVLNAADTFDCKWTTIQASTTDFKWCRESETSAANGSIQTLRESLNETIRDMDVRLCPFFINLPPNGQVQMSCPFNDSSMNFFLLTFRTVSDLFSFRTKFNKPTTDLNRVDLVSRHQVTNTDTPMTCNWTTAASTTATKDFNYCVNVQSTTTNGTITSIANTTDTNITCLFSVFASLGQRIQISCRNLNLLSDNSLLILSENGEIVGQPSLNNVYTSISNRMDVISTLSKGDSFQCNWTTVTIPPTTDFKLCRDGKATVAPGTITLFSNTTVGGYPSICRFTIIAPFNKRVKFSCPVITVLQILLFEYDDTTTFASLIATPAVVNKVYTSTGNEMNLLWQKDNGSFALNCTWAFV